MTDGPQDFGVAGGPNPDEEAPKPHVATSYERLVGKDGEQQVVEGTLSDQDAPVGVTTEGSNAGDDKLTGEDVEAKATQKEVKASEVSPAVKNPAVTKAEEEKGDGSKS